jgi:hypothetical protein
MSPAENLVLIWIAVAVTVLFVWHLVAYHDNDDER